MKSALCTFYQTVFKSVAEKPAIAINIRMAATGTATVPVPAYFAGQG